MASGSNFLNTNGGHDSLASSSRTPNVGRSPYGDDDVLDPLFGDDDELLRDDPLDDDDPGAPISFKRKQKQSAHSQPSRFLSTLTGNRLGGTPSPRSPPSGSGTPSRLPNINTAIGDSYRPHTPSAPKDGEPLDWYVEGPGRRVGYEDLTAIDWIFEYTKERQRLRVLYSSASGLFGYLQLLLDSSQIWVILILTGIAAGAVAAGIDVASDWLGDIKTGFCSSSDGGAFYLNRGFCCLGYDQGDKCLGWKPWAAALGITSVGGKWFIEYFFYLLLSVSPWMLDRPVQVGPMSNPNQVTFAVCAGVLVKEYSIHAKHSGIPELKTVLGGFIIQRFLSSWTLVTKSLGLVSSRPSEVH